MSEASADTAFTSLTTKGFLEGKQDNLEIDTSSSAYMQIVDGYKLKIKQLLITTTTVDETAPNLQAYLDNNSPNNQEGDVVFLNGATDNQKRSWIKTGSASQGVDGYVRLQTDYNVISIRAMFSSGSYISFSQASGQFNLVLGNSVSELGAHTLPINDATFNQASGSNVFDLLKSLETILLTNQSQSSQATQDVDDRFTDCTGVNGSDLGDFGGRFTDGSTIKNVLTETETDLIAAEADRAAIRSEFLAADVNLQNAINQEANTRYAADAAEAQARLASDAIASQLRANIIQQITDEENRAITAENAAVTRLDTIEGNASTAGSINKAQADAQSFATSAVSAEATLRASADNNLQVQIDSLQGAFQYKGYVGADGRIVHVDVLNSNHNQVFENATFSVGNFYKMNSDLVITFSDNSTLSVNTGDGLIVVNEVSVAGTAKSSDFHKGDNSENADIIREGMLDDVTIEKSSGQVKVVDGSIGRTQLETQVKTDIDNKVLKSGDDMSGALNIDKTVIAGAGFVGGYDYALKVKQTSLDTDSLTDIQKALLVENNVHTDGSGDALSLDYSNAISSISKYNGDSSDLTLASSAIDAESIVLNPLAKVYANGVNGISKSEQLGVNVGGTFVAQNASTSNLGMFSFSDTAGAQNNRAGYLALAPDNIDLDTYRVARVTNPLPVQDAALIVDDYTGVKHAAYFNGKVEINGTTIVPSASNDNEAVNLGDVKGKEREYTINVPALGSQTINHQLNTYKISPTLWLDNELVSSGFKVERTSVDSIKIYNNTTENVSNLEVLLYKFSI